MKRTTSEIVGFPDLMLGVRGAVKNNANWQPVF